MAERGIVLHANDWHRDDVIRICCAVGFAALFHLLLFQGLEFKKAIPLEVKEDFITIELVTLPPKPEMVEPAPEPPEIPKPPEIEEAPLPPPPAIQPKPKPVIALAPKVVTDAPDILASSRAAIAEDTSNTVPLSEAGTQSTPEPSQRSANDIRMDDGLKALAENLKCLNGFATECAEIRKDVFEDFQMTETDKVYTKKYAHTGMPVEFYGMSERQIREKLNLKFAGENGIVIIPGLLALDGAIWDALHGVNKKCEWKIAAPAQSDPFTRSGELSSAVRHGAIKDCPDYLPAATEERDRRNKFKLRVNE